MRKFLMIVPLVLSSLFSFAQQDTIGNFIAQENALIWQKVYHFPEADASAVNNFFFQNSEFSYNGNVGVIYVCLKDYSKAKYGQRPVYFNTDSRIKFIVQIKDNRYRVTLQSLEPLDTFIQNYSTKAIEDRAYLTNFFEGSPYFKKSGELKQSFSNVAPLLDETFISLFNYTRKKDIGVDDDF